MSISSITTANSFSQLVYTINTLVSHVNTLDLRPQPINWRGDWLANASYVLNDAVASNSKVYLSLVTNINTVPTSLTISTWSRML